MSIAAIDAAVAYERAAAKVECLSRDIGRALLQCPLAMTDDLDAHGRPKTHLWQAYNRMVFVCDWGHSRATTDEEQAAFLAETCPHCLEAWRLVAQRKAARQAMGIAKRSVRAAGKAGMRLQRA